MFANKLNKKKSNSTAKSEPKDGQESGSNLTAKDRTPKQDKNEDKKEDGNDDIVLMSGNQKVTLKDEDFTNGTLSGKNTKHEVRSAKEQQQSSFSVADALLSPKKVLQIIFVSLCLCFIIFRFILVPHQSRSRSAKGSESSPKNDIAGGDMHLNYGEL